MPTTQKTTSSNTFANTYNPASLSLFNQFGQQGGNVLSQDVQNPMQQIGFNQRIAQGNQFSFNLANRNNSNIMNRASQFGGNQIPGFLQNELNSSQNWLGGQQAQNFNQNLFYADTLRQQAATQMLGYRPLQTGGQSSGTQQQSTGGVGAWATPIANAGLSLATGGMSNLFSGGMSALTNGSGAGGQFGASNGLSNPTNAFLNQNVGNVPMGNASWSSMTDPSQMSNNVWSGGSF